MSSTSPAPGLLVFEEKPRRKKTPRHLADIDPAERKAYAEELGVPSMRVSQLANHYFGRFVADAAAMTDLPESSRSDIVDAALPHLITAAREQACDDGATRKTLWRLHDGSLVESVLMAYPDRVTVCISSQAGCGMNCPFCATGQAGLTRNLSTAEIVEQVRVASAQAPELPSDAGRLTNVVFMGMGEPLANYNAVVASLRRLTDPAPKGFGMSRRNIVVSTVGLVPAIDKLAAEKLPVTLALSLHAPDDELRNTLVPVNTRWNVKEAIDAASRYQQSSGRRVSIEYALIKDVNDQAWRGDLLGKLLARKHMHVNLIPLNPTPGSEWDASSPKAQREFVAKLEAHGVTVTVRDTRGREIAGACGQLAAAE